MPPFGPRRRQAEIELAQGPEPNDSDRYDRGGQRYRPLQIGVGAQMHLAAKHACPDKRKFDCGAHALEVYRAKPLQAM